MNNKEKRTFFNVIREARVDALLLQAAAGEQGLSILRERFEKIIKDLEGLEELARKAMVTAPPETREYFLNQEIPENKPAKK